MRKMKDLTDMQFGQWIVQRFDTNKPGKYYWICKCTCGAVKSINAGALREGRSRRCRRCKDNAHKVLHQTKISRRLGDSTKFEDLLGRQFGDYTVTSLYSKKPVKWNCTCKCGTVTIKWPSEILKQTALRCKSCAIKLRTKDAFETYLLSIQQGAKNRNIEFYITVADIKSIFEGKCVLSGLPIILLDGSRKNKGKSTASLDRINSSKGYTIDNVQWVHKDINIMKRNHHQNYFIELCKLITQKQQ